MRVRFTAFVIIALLNLVLAASPFLPFLNKIWQVDNPQAFYSTLAAVIGVDFLLITLSIGIFLLQEGTDIKNLSAEISKQLQANVIARRVRDSDFYTDFLAACTKAAYSVNISYLSRRPPDFGARQYQDNYYKALLRTIKKSPNTTFRRIIRSSPENRPWIVKLVGELKGFSNAHIALLDETGNDSEMPFALSVQVVDQKQVWIVAIKTHLPGEEFRDLFIEGGDVGRAMSEYYDRLWGLSTILLSAGELTSEGKVFLSPEPPQPREEKTGK